MSEARAEPLVGAPQKQPDARTPVAELSSVRLVRPPEFRLEIESLQLAAGEVLCLLGPTGAGKSTLLSLLAGLSRPDTGTLRRGGRTIADWRLPSDVQRATTLVFQRPLLLAGTVRYNVTYPMALRGERAEEPIDEVLTRLGLESLAHRKAHELSGGETQLAALARALAARPELLLLDEPTSSLDPARVQRVEMVVRETAERAGTTVVWATHNLFQARRVASRVALLLEGQVVETAACNDFFDSPRDPRTADFVQGRYIC